MTAGGQDSALGSVPVQIDTSIAHPARVYDYWLGGKDNYPADREAAEAVIRANPGIVPGVRANRAFLVRAVRHLVGEAGISQILDLGTGLPSVDNVHEVAQAINPDTRVVYVDNDPIVLVHAHALLVGSPGTIAYLDADLHQPAEVLRRAGQTLDLDRPVGLLLLMTLQFLVEDKEIAYGLHDTPSLVHKLQEARWLEMVWAKAVAQAVGETGLDCFPDACPWAMEEVVNEGWLPDTAEHSSHR